MDGQKGFSLIEVLVAVTILAIGLLGLAGLQVTAIRGNSVAIHRSQASALVADKIETFQNTPYASIAEGVTTENGLDGIFTRTSQVQKDVPVNDLKTVTVTVTWTDTITQQVAFQTIISKDG